jgi:hypothetical protein
MVWPKFALVERKRGNNEVCPVEMADLGVSPMSVSALL